MQQNNKHPVSKNGFKIFTLGLILAFLVGHFFKFYFNSNRLTQFFESKLIEQNLDFEFKISGIDFMLADGIWPAFGFYIEDLIITSKDVCKHPLQIVLKDSFVKIKTFKSIFNKKIHLSTARVGSARVLESKSLCESSQLRSDRSDLQSILFEPERIISQHFNDKKINSNKLNDFKSKFISSTYNVQKQLAGFFDRNESYLKDWPKIYIGEIFYIKDGQNIVLQNFSIIPDDKQLHLQADLNFSFSKIELQGLPNITFKFLISKPTLQSQIFTRYKEGRIQSTVDIDWLTLDYEMNSTISDLPVHSLLAWLKQQKVYQQSWQPDLLWLSCNIQTNGSLKRVSNIELLFEPCVADAEKGKFEFKNFKLNPFNHSKIKPFIVSVKNIPIKSFLKSLDRSGPYRIFSEFGVLSGDVTVKSIGQLEAKWIVSDLEALFSKDGVNAFQKIPKLELKMSFENKRFSGLVENVILDSGEFEGQFSYNLDQSLKNGMLQFSIKKLAFSPEVQSLLVGESLEGVSLYGQAKINDSEISKWRGSLGANKIKSSNAVYKSIKINFDYVLPEIKAKLKISSITAQSKDSYYGLMKSLSLDFTPDNDSSISINNLNAELKSSEGQGEWSGLRATLLNNKKKYSLRSQGDWYEKSFTGSIDVYDKAKQSWNWLLLGSFKDLYLAPSSQLIEKVQKSKLKGYKIPKDKFQKGMTKTEFKDIDFKKSSPLKLLKSLGVNFIESAKKIIPKNRPKE